MKLLFFIGSLRTGGKERRLIELLSYLKQNTDYEMLVVLRQDQIYYSAFYDLGIPYKLLTPKYIKGDKTLHFKFYKICKDFKPDIIHAWGNMPAFVSLLAVALLKIPHVNSQITSAPPRVKRISSSNIIDRINFYFSTIILSNSKAGIESFRPPLKKSMVIYNGINPKRFAQLPPREDLKKKYAINTPYAVVMVASFTENKDFDLFLKIAQHVTLLRNDITFIGAGGPGDVEEFQRIKSLAKDNSRILFPGLINNVEALVNACDVGVLFSPYGEGISNSILEYMALGKPVIANDSGGTRELVRHNENGYLVTTESAREIAAMIIELIDKLEKLLAFGNKGKEIVNEFFTLDKMGKAFEDIYRSDSC